VDAGLLPVQDSSKVVVLLSGHGGEGDYHGGAVRSASFRLLAGLGGEGEHRRSTAHLALDWSSCFVCRCRLQRRSKVLRSALACRGGAGRGCGGDAAFCGCLYRILPKWCYEAALFRFPRAEHMASKFDVVTFGRDGGPNSTSMAEALSESSRWSSTLHRFQVVRPRWRCGSWRLRFFVGNEIHSSFFFSDLGGGYALRSPTSGGGVGSQAPDCFIIFSVRVLYVKLEAFSSNSRFCYAIDAKGPPCKILYPPFV
jgi:hypothetical protein